MSPLSHTLLSTLEKSGFSYDTLRELERLCASAIRQPELTAQDRVTLFTLESVCYWLAHRLDDEVTTPTHQRIEQTMLPSLKTVIASLDSGNTEGRLEALDALIRAYLNTPSACAKE